MFGTGTEDYYGYSWGGQTSDFYQHPFHAQVRCHVYDSLNRKTTTERNTLGYSTETRTRSLDTITFTNSLTLDMEVWGDGRDMEYAVATHWYADAGITSSLVPDPESATLPVRVSDEPVLSFSPASQTQAVVVRYSPESAGSSTGTVVFTGGTGTNIQVSGSAYVPSTLLLADARADYRSATVGGTTTNFNDGA